MGRGQQQGRRRGRTIRKSDGHNFPRIESVTDSGRRNECGKLRNSALQVAEIVRTFRKPSEEAPAPNVIDLSARAEYSGCRQDGLGDRQEFVLVTRRAVQQQQGAAVGARWRVIVVREELDHAAIIGEAARSGRDCPRPARFLYATPPG